MKRITKSSLIVAWLLLFGVFAAAQSGQKPKLDLPVIRGFRLGMTTEEVQRTFNGVFVPASNENGETQYQFNTFTTKSLDMSGLRFVSVKFLDGKIVAVWLEYDDSVDWKNKVDDFAKAVSDGLGIPNQWQKSRPILGVYNGVTVYAKPADYDSERAIKGEGYTITATLEPYSNPKLSIEQDGYQEIINAREVKRKEDKRKNFKP